MSSSFFQKNLQPSSINIFWNQTKSNYALFFCSSILPGLIPSTLFNLLWGFAGWRSTKASKVWRKSRELHVQKHVPRPITDTSYRGVAWTLQRHFPITAQVCSSWCIHIHSIWVYLRMAGISTRMKITNSSFLIGLVQSHMWQFFFTLFLVTIYAIFILFVRFTRAILPHQFQCIAIWWLKVVNL